jgi:hypothetical protein
MRKNLYPLLFLVVVATISVNAQDRFVYAITDVNPTTASWSVLRKLDLKTGTYSDVLLNGLNLKQVAFDAKTQAQIAVNANNSSSLLPFSTGVAAIAYDKKNDRLYFTPMFIDQLRYVDLKTMKLYYVADQSFTGHKNLQHNDDGGVVSRMVIAPDGYGYAVTNDANNFVRFSTGKKFKVEQLGSLVDDPGNTGISIHNRCSSWGGDMVADDEGNLYLISASNSVFKINIDTKVAKWLGPIKGLPTGFTINGVAVTEDGNLLTGSQTYNKGWFVVDPKSWISSPYKSPKGVYLTSDLANSNYLSTHRTDIALMEPKQSALSNAVQIYPNPVDIGTNQFKLQFNKLTPGNYTIELTDVNGKQVMMQRVNITSEGQVQTVNLKRNTAQGIYLVKLSDIDNRSIFTQKLVVQ